MGAYLLRRVFQLVPTFLGATFLAFFIIQLTPGDFFTTLSLDPKMRPETIERLRAQFGLDQPLYVQYLLWIENILRLNLGFSFSYQQDVFQVAWPRIVNSFLLVITATILLYAIAIPIGVYGALRQYSTGDRVISLITYFFLAIPSFFFALIVIFAILKFKFATGIQILPVGGMTSSGFDQMPWYKQWLDVGWHLIAPAAVAVSNDIAGFTRFMRGQMLDTMGLDYIRTARAKGLAERVVTYKHGLRNAAIPFIASIGGILPGLIGGAGFVEVVMNWPGVTPFFLDALNSQDLYVLTGFLVITLLLLMVGNLLGDLLLAWVDPRIRYY